MCSGKEQKFADVVLSACVKKVCSNSTRGYENQFYRPGLPERLMCSGKEQKFADVVCEKEGRINKGKR